MEKSERERGHSGSSTTGGRGANFVFGKSFSGGWHVGLSLRASVHSDN